MMWILAALVLFAGGALAQGAQEASTEGREKAAFFGGIGLGIIGAVITYWISH